ncbi:hypothetical protein H0H93_016929 [Arthromyces matolae]|nr:hypothetical protein H0H93_016929 [Arthromyces matolae]
MSMSYDDASPNIIYTGNWVIGGRPQEFDGTTHGTNEAGATAFFTFTGTSVAVYGTVARLATSQIPVTSTYSLDGGDAVEYSATPSQVVQYRQLFFLASNLSYGKHTLFITCTTANGNFWLDYLQVGDNHGLPVADSIATVTQPGASSSTTVISTTTSNSSASTSTPDSTPASNAISPSMTSSSVVSPSSTPSPSSNSSDISYIDDTNSNIAYNGGWFIADSTQDYDDTVHGTQDEGAIATLSFSGTGVAVFGRIPQLSPNSNARTSSYAIDGGTPVSMTPVPSDDASYQQLFFQTNTLQDGNHTIVVTVGSGNLTFYLDYFKINGTSTSTPNSSSLASSSPSASASSGIISPASPVVATSKNNPGAIAGAIIGALVAIALGVVAFLWYRRRKAMRAPSRQAPTTPDPNWLTDSRFIYNRHNENISARRMHQYSSIR